MWMPLDTHHPSKHCYGPSTPPHGNSTLWWQRPSHHVSALQEWLEEQTNDPRCWLGLQISPDSNPIEHLWDMLEQVGSMAPSPPHTGPTGSTTNVLLPDTTGHPLRSYDHVLKGQSCFCCTEGKQNNIKSVCFMLWLISVFSGLFLLQIFIVLKCLYILHAFFCKLCSSSAYMVISLHSLAFNPLICAPLIMTFHTHQVEPSDSWLN